MTNGIPVCIECGGPTSELNEDENGEPCPACSERLLETLPGVFHAPWGQGAAQAEPSSSTEVADQVPQETAGSETESRQRSVRSQRSRQTFDDPPEPA